MAYAAGVPDGRPELYDTARPLVVHPLFPVAPEWELLITRPAVPTSMTAEEVRHGVHAAHDLVLERPVAVDEPLTITSRVVAVDRRSGGASQDVLFEATDRDGRTVWRTLLTSVFRGVELTGDPIAVDVGWPHPPSLIDAPAQPQATSSSHVRPTDAHAYTECARIWNPIHTDVAVARAAGLPAPILHGTATLARAVTACTEMVGLELADVTGIAGSFGAMVPLNSTIEIRLLAVVDHALHFDVRNHEGRPAVRDGCIRVR
jgi:acyl dehydratase